MAHGDYNRPSTFLFRLYTQEFLGKKKSLRNTVAVYFRPDADQSCINEEPLQSRQNSKWNQLTTYWRKEAILIDTEVGLSSA
jgi:hypothetical protein